MNIKRFCLGAPLPERKTDGAIGYDLPVCAWRHEVETVNKYSDVVLLPLGWGFEIPPGHVGIISPRSSTSHWGFTGYVDPDYRGQVFAKTTIDRIYGVSWSRFDRIAQLIIVPVLTPRLAEVAELSETQRGAGGHGSTGNQ